MACANEMDVIDLETDSDSGDIIFKAILDNDLKTIKSEIASGSTGLSKSSTGDMALHFACLNSKLDIITLLNETLKPGEIDTINIEEDDTICGTALHMSMDGQVDKRVAEKLLEFGANPNAKDAKGSPVIHELIYRAWEDFENDLKSGKGELNGIEDSDTQSASSDDNIADSCQTTAEKTGASYFDKLALLCKYGAEINAVNSETGMTALHFCCQNFYWSLQDYVDKSIPKWCHDFLKVFLEHGADPLLANNRGEVAMVYFAQRSYKPCHEAFMRSYRDVIMLLTPALSKVANKSDMYGRSLLHCAVEHSNYVFVSELLKTPCHVNAADKFGLTPLHSITHNITEDEEAFVVSIVSLLIQHGARVDSQDKHGSTPLHHAIHMKNHNAVDHLLKHGASVDITDKSGRTPRGLARIEGTVAIQKLLDLPVTVDDTNVAQVSDLRCGVYYPLCCSLQDDTNSSSLSEEPETVNDSDIEEWLKKHQMCTHNKKCVVQNSIQSLEGTPIQAELTLKDALQMKKEIYELATRAADMISNMNPMFKCRINFGGSVAEGTKVGSCDEFDLVFDLFMLRQHVEVIEGNVSIQGFAKLKVTNKDVFIQHDCGDLVNGDGYLKRLETSNQFHKYFEKALSYHEIWTDNHYFSFCGPANSSGECFNIGQLHFIWFGPFQKRQKVDVDITPVFCLEGWHSKYWNDNVQIANVATARAAGCYLVMKDTSVYLQALANNESDDVEADRQVEISNEETLFKISVSQIEHAVMRHLPFAIKNGYKIAKSIQLQCPKLSFDLGDISDFLQLLGDTMSFVKDEAGAIRGLFYANDFLTSFAIKTGLFHELHSCGICIAFGHTQLDDLNETVLHDLAAEKRPNSSEITEAVSWALRIYKRIFTIVTRSGHLPEYFLPNMDATKVRAKTKGFVKIISAFLKVIINLLETFEVPVDEQWHKCMPQKE